MTASPAQEISKEDLAELWFAFNHDVLGQLQARARELKRRKLTQEVIAARLGVGPAVVSRRLRGRQNMSMRTMHDLARAMNSRIKVTVEGLDSLAPANNNPSPWRVPQAGPEPVSTTPSGASGAARFMRYDIGKE